MPLGVECHDHPLVVIANVDRAVIRQIDRPAFAAQVIDEIPGVPIVGSRLRRTALPDPNVGRLRSATGNFIGFALVQLVLHVYTFLFKALPDTVVTTGSRSYYRLRLLSFAGKAPSNQWVLEAHPMG